MSFFSKIFPSTCKDNLKAARTLYCSALDHFNIAAVDNSRQRQTSEALLNIHKPKIVSAMSEKSHIKATRVY